jgi:hypothetical protein
LQFPELYSFAKNKSISLSKARGTVTFHDLFSLPVSIEAYNQLQDFQVELSEILLNDENDRWTYIWGNNQFSSAKAYKSLTGHSQVEPIYKWLWTPLLLQGDLDRGPSNFFRFENFWIQMEGFNQMVQTAWNRPVSASQPLKRLHIKMARTAKAIKPWKKTVTSRVFE